MFAFCLTATAFVLEPPNRLLRQRPVAFASQPTALPHTEGQDLGTKDRLEPPPAADAAKGLFPRASYGEVSPTTASLAGYSNLGCWSDASSRILTGSSTSGDDVNIERCQTFCSQQSQTIFGVEAANNCYCGNNPANSPASAETGDCSFACRGNTAEICGGIWRINIYSQTSQAATTASLDGYSNLGCWSDASKRILTGPSTSGEDVNIQRCQTFCSQQSNTIFGVEAANNCYCGNNPANSPASADAGDCSIACRGNTEEICGGIWRINVYSQKTTMQTTNAATTASPDGYSNLGCWSDDSNRILTGSNIGGNVVGVSYCQSFCVQNSYTIFGVEAANNCYCGNSLANNLASASKEDCIFPCVGNTKEICGSLWRINIYSQTATVVSSPPSTTTSSNGGSTDSSNSNSNSDSNSDRNIALGVGLGLGIPTLVVTFLAWCYPQTVRGLF
ncbi:WSC-domain-containing protein [Thozetella sp. PMI_491]|nr:WSC-domain-containing protein [Thozetella sp. PMI_491]